MKSYDTHKSTTEVRQGNRRMMNFRVLLFSIIAIIVAFLLILIVFNMMPQGNVVS